MKYPLESYSWIMESITYATKRMDKSAFLHRGTAIPKPIADFFDLPVAGLSSPRKIHLLFAGKDYLGRIDYSQRRSYRLFWGRDLAEVVSKSYPSHVKHLTEGKTPIAFPNMHFNRISKIEYSIEFEVCNTSDAVQKTYQEWTSEELSASINSYLWMLKQEVAGLEYNKAKVNRQLRTEELASRSKSSIEYRMANISAVLESLCEKRLSGYAPRGNVGSNVTRRIKDILFSEGYLDSEIFQSTASSSELDIRVDALTAKPLQGKPIGEETPAFEQITSNVFKRDPLVKAWVLQNANGHCELCGEPAPFTKVSGQPFLETHHVQPLSEGGPDTISNLIAVCPNCHRKCHYSDKRDEVKAQLIRSLSRLTS